MTRLIIKRTVTALLVLALALLTLSGFRNRTPETLPVVSIVAPSLKKWEDKNDVRQAELTYEDAGVRFTTPITIHTQGRTSAKASKHNFTIRMESKREMHQGWGAHKKYCLKANYIDPTHSCNVVSARLAAQMQRRYGLFDTAPNAGVVDGFPVWLVLNGKPAGLYTWNMPKDEWMLGLDKHDANHLAMFGVTWTEDVFFRADSVDYEKGWSFRAGEPTPENKARFERLYRFVRDATDEEFRANADQYLDLDACFNYYCFICVAYAPDNVGKNALLVTRDGQIWAPTLYDLDSLWGIDYMGTGLYEADRQVSVEDVIHCDGLFGRIRDCFPGEVRARYAELRQYPLSRENIRAEFERFRAEIPEKYYEMDYDRWYARRKKKKPFIRTYERMYSLIDAYLPTVDAAFGYVDESAPAAPASDAAIGG